MARNSFRHYFTISRENSDVATELPVVLKVAVEPSTYSDVAQDPAVDDTSSTSDSNSSSERYHIGLLNATLADPTLPCGSSDVGDNVIQNTDKDVQNNAELAAESAELEKLSEETDNASEVLSETNQTLQTQEQILDNPEQITPATVAMASENFRNLGKRVGLKDSDLRYMFKSFNQVSIESLISMSHESAATRQARIASSFRIVHEDLGSFAHKVKDTIVKIWKKIVEICKKIWYYITDISKRIEMQYKSAVKRITEKFGPTLWYIGDDDAKVYLFKNKEYDVPKVTLPIYKIGKDLASVKALDAIKNGKDYKNEILGQIAIPTHSGIHKYKEGKDNGVYELDLKEYPKIGSPVTIQVSRDDLISKTEPLENFSDGFKESRDVNTIVDKIREVIEKKDKKFEMTDIRERAIRSVYTTYTSKVLKAEVSYAQLIISSMNSLSNEKKKS